MNLSLDDVSTQRTIGRWAFAMAGVGLLGGQLHALSRFATDEGREDLEAPLVRTWAEPAADLLAPLLEWGDPDLVYHHYGKLWAPVLLATLLAALVVRRRRRADGVQDRVEAWWWRAVLSGLAVATVGAGLAYWTQWTGESGALLTAGFAVTLPGLLLTLLGSTALGVTLLVRRDRPVLPWALLALSLPLAFGVLTVTSLGNVLLPVLFAFGLLGRRAARAAEVEAPEPVLPVR